MYIGAAAAGVVQYISADGCSCANHKYRIINTFKFGGSAPLLHILKASFKSFEVH